MSNVQLPRETSAAPLMRRRQLRALRALEAAAAELLRGLKAADPHFFAQPGASAFPKKIFTTDEDAAPLPDGQSLAYLELVQQKWSEVFRRESPNDFTSVNIRMLQQLLIDAHILERMLIARLEALG